MDGPTLDRISSDLARIYAITNAAARDTWTPQETAQMTMARDLTGNLIELIQNEKVGR